MRVFKTKLFHQWAIHIGLPDNTIIQAIEETSMGQYEASLGGHLYKKRIAIGNKGKSGGLRTIIALQVKEKAFFLYGFAKNKQGNINAQALKTYKELAKLLLSLNSEQINQALHAGAIIEVAP